MMKRWLLALTVFCLIVGSVTFAVFATEDTEPGGEPQTQNETEQPTEKPTEKPTEAPTEKPTEAPTEKPTEAPTEAPEEEPTEEPTEAPTEAPAPTSGKCGDTMTWSFSGGKLTISGSGAMDDIEDYDNHPWEAWESQVKTIEFGPDIRSISKYAFYGCSNVTTIRFTGPVPGTIGSNAFKDITAKLKYPGMDPDWADVEKKNYGGNLTYEPEMSGTGGVFGDRFVWKLEGSTLTIVGKGNMDGWTSGSGNPPWYSHRNTIKKVVMSGRIYCIYTGAFRDMPNLSEVVWSEGLNIIYSSAFYNCPSLSQLTIPSTVHTIESYAFQNCEGLRSVTLPKSLKKLGQNAFANCRSLTTLKLPDGLETIGKKALAGTHLTKLEIPAKVTKLEAETFQNCKSLTEVTFAGKVKEIGNSCFAGCTRLTRVDLPSSVESIGENAFSGSGLSELVFAGNMPTFGTGALKDTRATLFYPKGNDSWGDARLQVLRNTYSNSINFYAGTPENFVEPTEAPTQPPVQDVTEAATEAVTLPVTEQTEPAVVTPDVPDVPELPAATEETEKPAEPVPQQPEKTEEDPGILAYWPVAVAAVGFFGGSALAIWALLIRPVKRAKRAAGRRTGNRRR